MQYKTFTANLSHKTLEIPDVVGQLSFDYTIHVMPPKVYTLDNVFFQTGQTKLSSESNNELDELAEYMTKKESMVIEIEGHTDNVGNKESNQQLSDNRANTVRDYFYYFKLILTVVTSFFFVYRWAQQKTEKSYGFWITQGVDRNLFVVYAIGAFSLVVSISEITGFLVINSYLGYHLPFLTVFLTIISIFLSNILFSTVGILVAELLFRPEIAGLTFVAIGFINYTVFSDFDSPFSLILKLESNFNSKLLPFGILFELVFIVLLGAISVYLQNIRDIDT